MAVAAVETHERPSVCEAQKLSAASTSDEANAPTVDVEAMQQRQMLLPDAREARQRERAEQRQRLDVVDVLELADVKVVTSRPSALAFLATARKRATIFVSDTLGLPTGSRWVQWAVLEHSLPSVRCELVSTVSA